MTRSTAKERLANAALELFEESGYEHTTVEGIAERAGVGRSTFFRYYPSKEDAIFPDHEGLRRQVAERLATSNHETAIAAVSDAVRLVMLYYVAEGERARRRYRLTSSIPTLRDREIASVAPYQRLFREFIVDWMGRGTHTALRAELMAAAVVAAHNHVLRRYLRGSSAEPIAEVDAALQQVVVLFTRSTHTSGDGSTTVVAFRSDQRLEDLVPLIRDLVGSDDDASGAAGF